MKVNQKGFTLMETVVALGITAVALSFFVAAFAPATVSIRKSGSVEEAKRLAKALEAEMNILRPTIDDAVIAGSPIYPDAFEKSFDWISRDGNTGAGLLIAFQYRADSQTAVPAHGVMEGDTGAFIGAPAAKSMILQNRIAPIEHIIGNPVGFVRQPYNSIEGPAFAIRLSQMHMRTVAGINELTVVPNDPLGVDQNANIYHPTNDLAAATVLTTSVIDAIPPGAGVYAEGYLLFQADFYLLESNSLGYLTTVNAQTPLTVPTLQQSLGKPVYTTQIGVNR